MVDLLSILQTICGLGMKITVLVETFRHNEDDCRRLRQLIFRVSEIAKCLLQQLNRTTYIVEGDKHPMMSGAFMGLKEALEHGHRDIVVACQPRKGYLNDLMRIIKADDFAKELRRVSDDILSNMMVAILATVVCHISVTAKTNRSDDALHADVKDLVNTVRARDASSSSKMVSLSKQIVDTLPRVHLPPEVSSSLQVSFNPETT